MSEPWPPAFIRTAPPIEPGHADRPLEAREAGRHGAAGDHGERGGGAGLHLAGDVNPGEAFPRVRRGRGRRHRRGGRAAAALPVVARRTVAAGLTGFEWAVGVPGSIGGAVRMNAGGHGSDMAASLRRGSASWTCAAGEDGVVPAADLDLGYRRSAVAPAPGRGRRPTSALARRRRRAGATPSSPRSCAWRREPTSPAARTPARCSPTRRATPPAGSSTPPARKGLRRRHRRRCRTKHANFIQADDGGRPTTSAP